jgi:hypothetical protein
MDDLLFMFIFKKLLTFLFDLLYNNSKKSIYCFKTERPGGER